MIFYDDPEKKERDEDSLLSYSMNMFLRSPDKDPELYLIFPMAKAVLLATNSIKEFVTMHNYTDPDVGFTVVGASKRGQHTWQVGVADRPDLYARIDAIMPMVPIVPVLPRDMHRAWRDYGGFTWAMTPFIEVGLIGLIDDPDTVHGMAKVDPFTFTEKLSKIPVMAVVSSGDEFMQLDWT